METPKVIILCGGKGTRSYPFTEYFPKVMMPIGGAPILLHLMRVFAKQGFNDFVLAAGHRKEILVDYFEGRYGDWNVTVLDTGEASDTGERIRRCANQVGSTFFATYGDGLGNVDLEALHAFHRSSGGLATVTAVPLQLQYGTIQFDDRFQVHRFVEKPVLQNCWVNAGFFVFDKRVFDVWQGQNLEREILPPLAERGNLYTFLHRGFWRSMDTTKDQQELEALCTGGAPPWMSPDRSSSAGACA